jgi:hypothetical protein
VHKHADILETLKAGPEAWVDKGWDMSMYTPDIVRRSVRATHDVTTTTQIGLVLHNWGDVWAIKKNHSRF